MKRSYTILGRTVYKVMWLLGKLPDTWHYFWANCLAFILKNIIRYRRQNIILQLKRVFGDDGPKMYLNGYYRHLADLIVEYIMLTGFDEKRFRDHAVMVNPELYEELHKAGHRHIFLLVGHIGNWEYYTGLQLYSNTEYQVLYKKQKGITDEILFRIRSKFGSHLLDKNKAGSFIVSQRNSGVNRTYIFAADQEPPYSSINLYTRFLGQSTATFTGAERLAAALKAPVIFAHGRQTSRGKYEVTLEILTYDASKLAKGEITRLFMKKLENNILEDPTQWLWSHKRWKHDWHWRKANDPNFDRQNIQIDF